MLCYSGQGRPTVWEPMATEEIACDTHRERGCRAMQGHTGVALGIRVNQQSLWEAGRVVSIKRVGRSSLVPTGGDCFI